MITFTEQAIADILETELVPLAVQHRREIPCDARMMAFDPDVERYRHAETLGYSASIVVRDDEKIVGYSVNFLAPYIHCKSVVMIYNDALWVSPDYRGQVGLELMERTREIGRRAGAEMIAWHAQPGTNLEKLLKHRQVPIQDITYTETL